jgi:prolyl 4-hydroxylase
MADKGTVDMATSGADGTASRLGTVPGNHRVPSPRLEQFVLEGFLDPVTCAELVERIDRGVRPSTIVDPNGDDAFRTSSTCDLDHGDPLVRAVDARLHELTGIPPEFGEPLQGQRYDVGQEFKAHTDSFDPDGAEWETYCAVPGQRTWTLMVYLNEPAAGGETHFLSTGDLHRPQVGTLLAWNNIGLYARPNPDTLHHGMKVHQGSKYIATKWFRERPWPWAEGLLR